uniref:DUF6546 domain-containing protein n=1 Tax=Bionectria ochroleuca TaxID=29856 RepID=A0A0B7JPJ4_BIOOC
MLLLLTLHYQSIFERRASHGLERLVVIVNITTKRLSTYRHVEVIRTLAPAVSRAVGIASVELESLSTSFIVDAKDFILFPPCMPKLAAAAAVRMPRLETIELCNGRKGLEATLQYRRGVGVTRYVKPLRSIAILVAYSLFPKDILASGANVASPADAIKYLKPINLVIRPISLHTITLEHRIQADKQLPLQTICHI